MKRYAEAVLRFTTNTLPAPPNTVERSIDLDREDLQMIFDALDILDPDADDAHRRKCELAGMANIMLSMWPEDL